MHCIIGLGNPGKKYELTRHNIGFLILDLFALKHKLTFKPSKRDYYYSEGVLESSEFFLIKPTTYMNLSGIAVLDLLKDNLMKIENLLVVVDDINLDLGKIRLRKTGSDGGHNGIKSIIYHLQSNSFPRLRFGVGTSLEMDSMADHVLSKFSNDESDQIKDKLNFTVELIEKYIISGYKSMSDHYSKCFQKNKLNSPDEMKK